MTDEETSAQTSSKSTPPPADNNDEEEIVVPPKKEPVIEEAVSPDELESQDIHDPAGSVEIVRAPTLPSKSSGRYGVARFVDHYSLPLPSSTIRFRSSAVSHRVYENQNNQFVMVQDPDKITVKMMNDSTSSLKFLRAVYSLQCLFFALFLVVFAVQILLFLIMDLTIDVGATSSPGKPIKAVGVILSIPVYVFGLASALVLAGAYIADTWGGSYLIRTFVFGRYSEVATAWTTFVVYLGIPLLVMACALFSGTEFWWAITLMTWFGCIALFYVFFCLAVVVFEMYACLEVMKNQYDDDKDDILSLIRRSIVLRQIHTYGGMRSKLYLARGTLDDMTDDGSDLIEESVHYHSSLYSKFTMWKWTSRFFDRFEEPGRRTYTLEDARGVRPFITRHTWSLEKLYCRQKDSRYVAVVDGPSALTRAQMRSNVVCALLGHFLVILLVASFLTWCALDWKFVLIVVILVVIYMFPSIRQSWRISNMTRDLILARNKVKGDAERPSKEDWTNSDGSRESEGLFHVWEVYRMTKPKELVCWFTFAGEVIFLYIWPFVSLMAVSNWAIAVLFFFVALFTFLRYYFNAAIVLEEVGNLDYIHGDSQFEVWRKRNRVNDIVGNITRGRSRRGWLYVLCLFLFVFFALFLGALAYGQADSSSSLTYTYLPGFYYEQQQDLPYPTCRLGKGLQGGLVPNNSSQAMADYVYLAGLAYRSDDITQGELDNWFGPGVATNNPVVVENFRTVNNYTSPVSYKLITFGGSNALIAIRGTTNPWDALADAQLWSAAACFQIVRFAIPFGGIFTPIFDELVNIISWLESDSIQKISFYKETTAFAKFLLNSTSPNYSNVQVCGHSLGGGLSIITGAQAGIPAIGLSGPNAVISRRSFEPPLNRDQLNTLTFNIIPDRDPVPMFDDRAMLYQNIKCRAADNNFVGCHDSTRSLCEVLFTCGTQNRPAICECVTEYGFPEPIPFPGTSVTFAEACANVTST